jgi:phenylpropionate dioxygenase-like ring-hydroxylating dioxygenase large terminal subunit
MMTAKDTTAQYPLPPSTVESGTYTDPARFEREMEEIFFQSWMPACPSGDISGPRDYVLFEELRQSIVIVRGDAGEVFAWHNVCQHRGTQIVTTPGQCEKGRFTCPWHGFQYDLTGKVRFMPMKAAFDAALIEDLRAPPVRVAEWSGFIWICLSAETPDLKTFLGDIHNEIGWFGLDRFTVPYRSAFTLKANWKTVVDAFNETWHVPFTHQSTLSEIVQWGKAHLRICNPHSWMSIPVKGLTDRMAADADHRAAQITHYLAFPNTFFSCFPTHLQTWNIWPVSPNETHFTAWGMVGPCPEGVTAEKWQRQNDRDWQNFLDVSAEDSAVIENWGKVARSLGQTRYMFNTAEGRLSAFHQQIATRVG